MAGALPDGARSTAVEDYLLALYRLETGGATPRGAQLAAELGVTAASVTQMAGRLRRQGLIQPGRPLRLSPVGLATARTLASRHRLLERFLVDVLGFPWDEVHDEAHRLEHAISPRVTEALARLLGHPATCPHGHPIMGQDGVEPEIGLRSLAELAPGDGGVVRRIVREDSALLRGLREIGIGLDTAVRRRPDVAGGGVGIEVAGEPQVIGREAATLVLVGA